MTANQWVEIDPVIEGVRGDFALLSCSGWAPLNLNQVFVFGGYNEEADNQSSSTSFVIECTFFTMQTTPKKSSSSSSTSTARNYLSKKVSGALKASFITIRFTLCKMFLKARTEGNASRTNGTSSFLTESTGRSAIRNDIFSNIHSDPFATVINDIFCDSVNHLYRTEFNDKFFTLGTRHNRT
jgi:hypothetical protein